MAEVMRAASPLGPLARGLAGTVGSCLILNLPGSVDGANESVGAVLNVSSHAHVFLAGGNPFDGWLGRPARAPSKRTPRPGCAVMTSVNGALMSPDSDEWIAVSAGTLPMSVGGVCTVEVSASAVQVWTVDVQSG